MNTEDHNSNINHDRYRYLPILSLVLLIALAALTLKIYRQRPPKNLRQKLASFQLTLQLIPEYYENIDEDQLFEAAMKGVVDILDDPYSSYFSPEQLKQSDIAAEGEFGGVGIHAAPSNGNALIVRVIANGPGDAAGLKQGDIITEADGDLAETIGFQKLISIIRGRPDTPVDLTIKSPETGEEKEVTIVRELIDVAPVERKILNNNTALLEFKGFNKRSVEALKKELHYLSEEAQINALILDLRDNPGGLLNTAVEIADMFLPDGRIVALEYAGKEPRKEEFFASEDILLPTEIPMAIIVNERSASAAELLSGALQSYGRAKIIGTNTVGKGSVDSIFSLPDGSGLGLKIAHYIVGDDMRIEGVGIEPDIVIGEMPELSEMPDWDERKKWLKKYEEMRELQENHALEYLEQEIGGDEHEKNDQQKN